MCVILYYVLVQNCVENRQYLLGKYKKRISHLDQGYYLRRQAEALCDELILRAKCHDRDDLVYSVISFEVSL